MVYFTLSLQRNTLRSYTASVEESTADEYSKQNEIGAVTNLDTNSCKVPIKHVKNDSVTPKRRSVFNTLFGARRKGSHEKQKHSASTVFRDMIDSMPEMVIHQQYGHSLMHDINNVNSMHEL